MNCSKFGNDSIERWHFGYFPRLLAFLATLVSLQLVPTAESFAARESLRSSVPRSQDGFRQLKIAFVTGNEMKAKEVDTILKEYAETHSPSTSSLVDLRVLKVDLPELQEVDTMAIAKNKALLAAQLANGACLVEDTSLHFHALGGMPGPYIKWFQEKLKSAGLYNILAAYEDKSATAVCTLAFSPAPHADPVLFTGECHGQIVPPEPGKHGFGWDSIFVPDEEYEMTTTSAKNENQRRPFSQMNMQEKNQVSHRGQAVRQLAAWLGRNQEVLYRRQQGEPAVGHQGLNFIETTTSSKMRIVNNNNKDKLEDNGKAIIMNDSNKK